MEFSAAKGNANLPWVGGVSYRFFLLRAMSANSRMRARLVSFSSGVMSGSGFDFAKGSNLAPVRLERENSGAIQSPFVCSCLILRDIPQLSDGSKLMPGCLGLPLCFGYSAARLSGTSVAYGPALLFGTGVCVFGKFEHGGAVAGGNESAAGATI